MPASSISRQLLPLGPSRAVLLAFALVFSNTAWAQEWPRESTPPTLPVYQMARPGYDPIGISLDSFLIFPSVSETAAYDDNIFASDRKVADDFVNTTNEAVALASQWSRHSLSGHLYTAQQVYAGHPSEDANTYGADASGRLDVTGDSFFQLDGSFIQQPQQRASPEASNVTTGRPIYNTSDGRLNFVQRMNRWLERVQGYAQRTDYVTSGNTSRNNLTQTYSDRLSYDLSEELSLFVQGSYELRDWDVRPAERNFDTLTGLVGVTAAIPTVVEADFGVGVLRQTYSNSAFKTLVAPAVNGQVTWNVLPLTSILASVSRTVTGTETFCGSQAGVCQTTTGAQPATAGAGQRNTLATTLGEIGAQHEFWHDLLGSIRFRYEQDVFDFNNLVDNNYEAATNARYLINRYLEADLNYAYRARTANLPDDRTFNSGPYTENVISVTLKAGL